MAGHGPTLTCKLRADMETCGGQRIYACLLAVTRVCLQSSYMYMSNCGARACMSVCLPSLEQTHSGQSMHTPTSMVARGHMYTCLRWPEHACMHTCSGHSVDACMPAVIRKCTHAHSQWPENACVHACRHLSVHNTKTDQGKMLRNM